MRTLVVSAHYPPNFVSGGTLAPQRVARGLRARGHEVSVYAGWLGEREPLDTWTDVDEEGIPVRWIVTTPWTAWSDTRNFDNPDVTTDFRLHLDEVRPDLVHVHSLQTLGKGIVEAAADAGARVVVTMHDFWWMCARQFLCDRALRPCSVVLSCGMCHCQVHRDWLLARNETVQRALDRADLVLAVSESSGQILRANGVGEEGRDGAPPVVVDENGVPPLPAPGRVRLAGPEVVFLYTGGHDAMKGVGPLLEAAGLLGAVDGWSLRAHGIEPYLEENDDVAVDPDRVHVLPRFAPGEADAVFDAADVLILPSVVRESHSLVTREALARGMPVITGDTFGPEEVVRDGENGLVVPAGNGRALAHAMRSVVEDRDLARRLAEGARRPVAIRAISDQLDELDARFRRLVADPPRRARPDARRERPRAVRRVLFLVGIDGAPLRYRGHFAAEALGLMGVETWVRHYRSPEAPGLAAFADAVVVYRVPATRQVLALVEATKARGAPVFFDVDDLVFDPAVTADIASLATLPQHEVDLYLEGVRRYRTTLEACDAYIGSTNALVSHVAGAVGITAHRWANGVGIGPARASDAALAQPRTAGPRRVGYLSGTKTHDRDWAHVEAAMASVLDARPDVELWLGGLVTPSPALDRFRGRVRRLDMKPWWELPWVLRDVDVNLAPLEPGSRFNDAKSAIKWLEAALVETVTVATPTEPFREVVAPGRNGLLAETPEEFATAVLALLDDEAARVRMGARARRDALLGWSPHLQGRRYLDILEAGALGRTRPSSWTEPVVLDEPWHDVELESYIVPNPMFLAPIDPVAPPGSAAGGDGPAGPARPAWRQLVHRARRAVAP